MATTLVNLKKRRQLIELSHQTFYRPRWGYQIAIMRVSEHNPRTGEIGYRETKKKLAGTLTVLGGGSITGLPDDIAAVPAVRAAVRAGRIRLEREGASLPADALPVALSAAPPIGPESDKQKTEPKARSRRGQ